MNNPKRPVAFNLTKNELLNLIKKRSKIYSKSMYNIVCDKLTKNEIAKKVIEIYETI